MMRNVGWCGIMLGMLVPASSLVARADDLAGPLRTIRAVASEGNGNKEAGVAWRGWSRTGPGGFPRFWRLSTTPIRWP